MMALQTREQRNHARRLRYKVRTWDTHKALGIRNLGIINDRAVGHLSYREIAKKHGVSLGCVQKVLKRYQ